MVARTRSWIYGTAAHMNLFKATRILEIAFIKLQMIGILALSVKVEAETLPVS